MKWGAVKEMLALVLYLNAVTLAAQNFNDATFWQQENQIDTLLSREAFAKSIPLLEQQISYVKETGRIDSLHRYTYKLGRAYLKGRDTESGISRTKKLVGFIERNQPKTSEVLKAISELSYIYYDAGEDSLTFKTDEHYFNIVQNYPEATAMEKSNAHYALGFDYQVLFGNAKKSIYHNKEALALVLEDSLQYKIRVLDCMNALGAAYWKNGSYTDAEKSLLHALDFSRVLTDSLDKWVEKSYIYGNLSLVYMDVGNLVKAKDILYASLRLNKQIIESAPSGSMRDRHARQLINNYHNLARLNLLLGDVSKSYELVEYVKNLREKWLVSDHSDNSETYEALGSIQIQMGDYDKALENFQKYRDAMLVKTGRYSYTSALAYGQIADALFDKKEYQNAIENYSESIAINKKITDESSGQELAADYLMRSRAYAKLGQYKRAETDVLAAKRIYENDSSAYSPDLTNLLLIYARYKMDQNQLDSARYFVQTAYIILISRQKRHAEKYESPLSKYIAYLPNVYRLKAQILIQDSHSLDADKEALAYLDTAARYLDNIQKIYVGESSILNHFDSQSGLYSDIENLCYSLYQKTGDETYLKRLYTYDESHKSVLVRRHLHSFTSLRLAHIPDSIFLKEHTLLSQLSDFENMDTGKEDLYEIETEYNTLLETIKTTYPKYYNLKYSTKVESLSEVQANFLKPGQNLIQYILTDSSLYAIVITTTEKRILKLAATSPEDDISELNKSIISRDNPEFKRVSLKLYRTLFEPVEPLLEGKEIFIVPDGPLFNLNFEVLLTDTTSVKPHYLLDGYTISYLLSGTTAIQYQSMKSSASEGMLSFAPGFFDSMKETYKAAFKGDYLPDVQYLHNIQQPFAVAAAENASRIFSGKAFISGNATERNFKNEASKYKIIHLGTHTEINNISPLLSRLVLAKDGSNQTDDDDGYLNAYEIYNLNLRAELTVLTACETGVGKKSSSEGALSLAHSFAYAGCPSIVMSLWQIDEKTSSGIIEHFYKNLSNGMPKNRALRNAKLSYLKAHPGELSSPYYWSGLVLLGDTSPISGTSTASWWWLAGIGIIALVFALFFIRFRKKTR